ncbi:MAG: hypothetical protein M1454_01090 [Candidatus Thermoplasmatota archaeon]|nr:hypothetical protein [Candidatus Thermoplasmatota archaeon]MCL5731151.1 hypothetical protein [Candidatus Thermoplasmatota archaeon]
MHSARTVLASFVIIAALLPAFGTIPVFHTSTSLSPISGPTSTPPVWAFNGSYEIYNGTVKTNGTSQNVSITMTIVDVNNTNGTYKVIMSGTGDNEVQGLISQIKIQNGSGGFLVGFPYLAVSPLIASILPIGPIIANFASAENLNISISSAKLVTTPAGSFSAFIVSLSDAGTFLSAAIDGLTGIFATASMSNFKAREFVNLTLTSTNVPPTQYTLINNLNGYLAGDNLYIIGGILTVLDAVFIGMVMVKRIKKRGH